MHKVNEMISLLKSISCYMYENLELATLKVIHDVLCFVYGKLLVILWKEYKVYLHTYMFVRIRIQALLVEWLSHGLCQ